MFTINNPRESYGIMFNFLYKLEAKINRLFYLRTTLEVGAILSIYMCLQLLNIFKEHRWHSVVIFILLYISAILSPKMPAHKFLNVNVIKEIHNKIEKIRGDYSDANFGRERATKFVEGLYLYCDEHIDRYAHKALLSILPDNSGSIIQKWILDKHIEFLSIPFIIDNVRWHDYKVPENIANRIHEALKNPSQKWTLNEIIKISNWYREHSSLLQNKTAQSIELKFKNNNIPDEEYCIPEGHTMYFLRWYGLQKVSDVAYIKDT